jgi:hypothetical protein
MAQWENHWAIFLHNHNDRDQFCQNEKLVNRNSVIESKQFAAPRLFENDMVNE